MYLGNFLLWFLYACSQYKYYCRTATLIKWNHPTSYAHSSIKFHNLQSFIFLIPHKTKHDKHNKKKSNNSAGGREFRKQLKYEYQGRPSADSATSAARSSYIHIRKFNSATILKIRSMWWYNLAELQLNYEPIKFDICPHRARLLTRMTDATPFSWGSTSQSTIQLASCGGLKNPPTNIRNTLIC